MLKLVLFIIAILLNSCGGNGEMSPPPIHSKLIDGGVCVESEMTYCDNYVHIAKCNQYQEVKIEKQCTCIIITCTCPRNEISIGAVFQQ